MTTVLDPAFLLVETRTGRTAERFVADATAQARAGVAVTVWLVADAVLDAVRGVCPEVGDLLAAGGTVWVDDFTVAQRGVRESSLLAGITVVSIDRLAATMLGDARTVWH